MPNNPDKIVCHLQSRFREVSAADATIKETTDDQLILWLAADHLTQAEHDLQLAIEYAEATKTFSKAALISIRLQLIVIAMLHKYVSWLLVVPPQLTLTAIVSAQLAFIFFGMPWLAFGLHLNPSLLLVLTFAIVITLPLMSMSNKQLTLILNTAKQLALSAQERLPELPSRTDT